MPANRNALIRYKTIDNCLRNRFRKWTLDDLIDACSDALYEYEGIDKGVSRRTVQMDIQMMRSEKLGYNAPIVVVEKKYYTYEDPDYSITNIPLTEQDLNKLTEVVDILRQFKGFAHFQELSGMVQRLEDKIYTSKAKTNAIIHLDKNESLRGLQYLEPIYQAILQKESLKLSYQSFRRRAPDTFVFWAYMLKEYRNRWYILGTKEGNNNLMNLALDRLEGVERSANSYKEYEGPDLSNYFDPVIGVTVNEGQAPETVRLFVTHSMAPYLITKPLHHSQKVMDRSSQGVTLQLKVQRNFELEKEILSLSPFVKVLEPDGLRRKIYQRLRHGLDYYESDLSAEQLPKVIRRFAGKGYAHHKLFLLKEVEEIKKRILHHFQKQGRHTGNKSRTIPHLLGAVPDLLDLFLNDNLAELLAHLLPDTELLAAHYSEEPEGGITDWQVDHLSFPSLGNALPEQTVLVRLFLYNDNHRKRPFLAVPGSQHEGQREEGMSPAEIQKRAQSIEAQAGDIFLSHPLLITRSPKARAGRKAGVVYLVFGSGT
ncbi:MAG: WYL domain-containing protein [Bacteroidota bacterium]